MSFLSSQFRLCVVYEHMIYDNNFYHYHSSL